MEPANGWLKICDSLFFILFNLCSTAISILVITTTIGILRAIANVNRKAQDKINQRTARAKADSKPKNYVDEMQGPQRGSQPRIQTAAQKRKEQEFNKRAGIIEPEEAPSAFAGKTKPKPYYR